MRPREDELIDSEIAEQLDAIDATLAGEPVSPRFAELAELALLLSASRPEGPRPEFAAELDRRVEGRFVRGGASARRQGAATGRGRWRGWGLTPALGMAAGTAVAAVLVAVVLVRGGGGPMSSGSATTASRSIKNALAPLPAAAAKAPSHAAGVGAAGLRARAAAPAPEKLAPPQAPVRFGPGKSAQGAVILGTAKTRASGSGSGGTAGAGSSGTAGAGAINGTLSPAPLPNGRKIVQSSMLQLGTPPNRIDAVAQEVFEVVRAYDAIVESSNVSSTGGPGASAQFQLRVPSASLPQALSELSRLRYANVISRIDDTQDVNSPYLSAERGSADARTALVKLRAELAAATLETQIARLREQIANEKAALAHAQSSLGSLNRRVGYSDVNVSVQATTGGSSSGGGGFGLRKAGHDALRVLEVTAGVALIAFAALVPLALLLALAGWLAITVQRRRRERALDLA
jgi:hypothetical protein